MQGSIAKDADEALHIGSSIGFPVAMKITSPDISHKSDAGGVVLNIRNEDVRDAFSDMILRIRKTVPAASIEGVLVQQMAP